MVSSKCFRFLVESHKKNFDILFFAALMIVVYIILYENIVMFPYILVTLLIVGYSVYKKRGWLFHGLSFLLFFPWLVGNECITIYDRQFSIQLFQVISILISVYIFFDRQNNEYGKESKIAFFCGDVIIAATFFGLPIIRAVENRNIMLAVTLLFLALYWSEFLSRAFERLIKESAFLFKLIRVQNRNDRKEYIILYAMMVIMVGVSVALSMVYYPGIITRDCASIYMDAQYIGDSSYRTDIHSFAWTIIIAAIDAIFHNYFAITLMLAVAFVFAWFYYMKVLYDCGLTLKVIVSILVIWFCIPGNWYYLVCSWKDIPFAICMLIVSSLICNIFFGNKPNILTYISLTLSSFGMAVFRSNGQVVLVVLAIVAIVAALRRRKQFNGMALVFGISLVMLGLFKGPIFKALDVSEAPEGLYTLPYVDGIWENVHQGAELSEETIEFIEKEIMPLKEFRDAYVSAYTNRYVFSKGFERISLEKARRAYIDCLKLHPFITISARFKRTYNIWGLMLDSEFPADRNYILEIPDLTDFSEDYQWEFNNAFKTIRENISQLTSATQAYGFVTMTFSRCGFCIILWVLLLRVSNKNGRELLFLITPPAVNTVVLFIGSCYADYRYVFPMFMMTVPLIGCALISQNYIEKDSNHLTV